MRSKRQLILLLTIIVFGFDSANSQDTTLKPNIILILVDQMRPDHLGKKTPTLMSLAANGVNFNHAYTPSPLCQPARTSIITGLYPSQTKIYGNQTGPLAEELRDNTFMNKLRRAGYYTALIGKHHYIDRFATGIDMVKTDEAEIMKYGFNYVVQVADVYEHKPNANKTENIDDYIYYLRKKQLEKKYFDNIDSDLRQGKHPLSADDTEDGFIGLKACEFIESYDKNKPFYLNVSFIGPHPPYAIPGEFITKPAETKNPIGVEPSKKTSKKRAIYADMTTHIDNYIAKLIKTLKNEGLYENTVFIFTSDHGDNLGDYGIWDKRYFYEQSSGVPLFISGKGISGRDIRIGNITSNALVSTLDIFPTIMNLAGIDISSEEKPGKNLLDIIGGKKDVLRNAVYSQLGTLVMIRDAKWKMVFDPEQGGTCYLFNLVNDPSEKNNLTGVPGYESITADLTSKLLSFYIGLDQATQMKEQLRLQKVRVSY